jgi:hypothetical protein
VQYRWKATGSLDRREEDIPDTNGEEQSNNLLCAPTEDHPEHSNVDNFDYENPVLDDLKDVEAHKYGRGSLKILLAKGFEFSSEDRVLTSIARAWLFTLSSVTRYLKLVYPAT